MWVAFNLMRRNWSEWIFALRFMPPLAEFRREIRRHRAEFQAPSHT